MIRAPRPHEFSQGTLFSGGLAERYVGPSVHGLVITARCDAEHEKVDLFNYVPVVPLEDWLLLDGRERLARRLLAEASGSMRSAMAEAALASAVLDLLGAPAVREELARDTSKKGKAVVSRFEKWEAVAAAAESALNPTMGRQEAVSFLKTNGGACKGLIRELTANRAADIHFLDKVEPSGEGWGYVVLLREIRFISGELARAVASGLDKESFDILRANGHARSGQLWLESEEDFCMPVGVLESPFVELLMQRLTQLFARVGVADLSMERTKSLLGIVDSLRDEE